MLRHFQHGFDLIGGRHRSTGRCRTRHRIWAGSTGVSTGSSTITPGRLIVWAPARVRAGARQFSKIQRRGCDKIHPVAKNLPVFKTGGTLSQKTEKITSACRQSQTLTEEPYVKEASPSHCRRAAAALADATHRRRDLTASSAETAANLRHSRKVKNSAF